MEQQKHMMMKLLRFGYFRLGTVWDEGGNSEIVQILVSYDSFTINSIQFIYAENSNSVRPSRVFGKPSGSSFKHVAFDYPSERLTSVSGEYSYSNQDYDYKLQSLTFCTNKRKYGPFGAIEKQSWYRFNYEFGATGFGGFHGSVYCGSIYSIGVYCKPLNKLDPVKTEVGSKLDPVKTEVGSKHDPVKIEVD